VTEPPPVLALAKAVSLSYKRPKAVAIENDLRGTLRDFGLKVAMVGKAKFEARHERTFGSLAVGSLAERPS